LHDTVLLGTEDLEISMNLLAFTLFIVLCFIQPEE